VVTTWGEFAEEWRPPMSTLLKDAKGFAVSKDITLYPNEPGVVRRANPDHLVDLLSSCSDLRINNRVLLDRLRLTLQEMREIRSSITRHNTPRISEEVHAVHTSRDRYGLTRREAQVAKLLALGRSNQAIARELSISQHTARHHTQRILSKLEVHSRGEAGAKLRSAVRRAVHP
jgi:DNA-binding CsgD family transcriptional regulator